MHDVQVRGRANTEWWGVVIDAPDARSLAEFYAQLLGWTIAKEEPGYAVLAAPAGSAYLGFQSASGYVRPVWPPEDGQQQMMMHLDVEVDELDAAVAGAIALGASVAEYQPQENVRVLLDPAGHPFCLYLDE
jgi:predicted enzyme related to lactoylglutathione lyase